MSGGLEDILWPPELLIVHAKNYGNLSRLKTRRDCMQGIYKEAKAEVDIRAAKTVVEDEERFNDGEGRPQALTCKGGIAHMCLQS